MHRQVSEPVADWVKKRVGGWVVTLVDFLILQAAPGKTFAAVGMHPVNPFAASPQRFSDQPAFAGFIQEH